MKEKYKNLIDSYKQSNWGSYVIYNYDKETDYDSYESIYKQLGKYYNIDSLVEESDEQRAKRLAKEKAEKRNKTINSILS